MWICGLRLCLWMDLPGGLCLCVNGCGLWIVLAFRQVDGCALVHCVYVHVCGWIWTDGLCLCGGMDVDWWIRFVFV